MNIAIIGCGAMGSALLHGLKKNKNHKVYVFDRHSEKVRAAKEGAKADVVVAKDVKSAVEQAEVILLVVKPKGIVDVLIEAVQHAPKDALFVSCAAGVQIDTLEKENRNSIIVRAMPNIGAGLQKSTTGVFLGRHGLIKRDYPKIKEAFLAVGEVYLLPNEEAFHTVTALCGSGPAYFLLGVEAMVDEGVRLGMKRDVALLYAKGALRAAAALLDAKDHEEPASLRNQITSPGGTTIAGLMAMEDAGGRTAFKQAVQVAERRSREMSAEQSPSKFRK